MLERNSAKKHRTQPRNQKHVAVACTCVCACVCVCVCMCRGCSTRVVRKSRMRSIPSWVRTRCIEWAVETSIQPRKYLRRKQHQLCARSRDVVPTFGTIQFPMSLSRESGPCRVSLRYQKKPRSHFAGDDALDPSENGTPEEKEIERK